MTKHLSQEAVEGVAKATRRLPAKIVGLLWLYNCYPLPEKYLLEDVK